MKKLIIGVAAVAFAATVHAASAMWGLEKDSAKTYGNLTAYVVNGSDYATVTALLTAGGESVATDFNTYVVDSVVLNSRGAGSSTSTGISGTTLAWFIFADDKIQDGSSYSTTGAMDVSAYVYTPPQSSPASSCSRLTRSRLGVRRLAMSRSRPLVFSCSSAWRVWRSSVNAAKLQT